MHVEVMKSYTVSVAKHQERSHGIEHWIILKWTLHKHSETIWTAFTFSWFRAGFCE